jgi:membrane protease YdiL (CAAX protease family)
LAKARGIGVLDALPLAIDPGSGPRTLLSYGFELGVAGLASYAAALAILGLATAFYRRPARSFLTAAPRFRWRLVATGLLIGAVVIGAALAAQSLLADTPRAAPLLRPGESLGARLGYAGLAAACLYLAALAEEIIFRGVLLQLTAAFTRSLPLILALNGIAFSLAHFDPDPSGLVIRMLMGVGWAWIALRSGGVELTTGVHLANNLMISLFLAPVSFKPAAPEKLDPVAIALELGTVLACLAAVEILARRRERRQAQSGGLAPAEEPAA